MSESALTFSTDWSWIFLALVLVFSVPLLLLIFVAIFRYVSRGNFMSSITIALTALVAILILVVFIRSFKSSQVIIVKDAHIRAIQDQALQYKKNQPVPVPVNVPVSIKSDAESPVVARKPQGPEPVLNRENVEVPVAEPLPDWVISGLKHTEQNKANLLESSQLVFESGLFVTRDEAQYDALAKAGLKLKANLQLRYPQYRFGDLEISPDEVRHVALRRSYYQLVEHNFGNVLKNGEPFKQNMYRAYLEIEDSPAVRASLFKKWKQNIGNERTAWLGGGFGLVTLLCLGVAVYLRATHHPATIKSTQ